MRIAYESANYKVVGATIAKKAAIQLEKETGIESFTLAQLLINMKRNIKRFNKTVIVVDEAGLISSTELLELLINLKNSSSKLVLDLLLHILPLGNTGSSQQTQWAPERAQDLQRH
jgi:ATP-dependent exoDNAse (exonuclease V) alpha subunit